MRDQPVRDRTMVEGVSRFVRGRRFALVFVRAPDSAVDPGDAVEAAQAVASRL